MTEPKNKITIKFKAKVDFATGSLWSRCCKIGLPIIFLAMTCVLSSCNMIVLDPSGRIAEGEKQLMIVGTLLMLIVVLPVLILTFVFAWKYRASNNKAKYTPDWADSTVLEIVWWSIPIIIVTVLAVITWYSSHEFEPSKPLDSKEKPIEIQVIALDWKWLFIYPEQGIASINFVQFPSDIPINFKITSDAPMNSFLIPQLGGQIYAMQGMQTKLHLIADKKGDFYGMSANYSGVGFSGMKFVARASSKEEFEQWVELVKKSPNKLTMEKYNGLVPPSRNNNVEYFSSVQDGLFMDAVMKYMIPGRTNNDLSKFYQ